MVIMRIHLALLSICLDLLIWGRHVRSADECNQDILDRSFVTQCSPVVCEPVLENENDKKPGDDWPSNKEEIVHIVSSRRGDRFKVHKYKAIDTTEFFYEESHVNGSMFVSTNVKYQRILGFGTTLSDAACTNADTLPEETRHKLISDYFSVGDGIGLNLIKVPIGSSKYSFSNYVLDQPDNNQVELSPYDIDHRIPLIKDAMKVAGRWKSRMKILASSASAPPEFKEGNRMVQGSYLRRDRSQEYAKYLIGFIDAYKSHELDVWSLILSESPVSIDRDNGRNDTLNYNSMAMKPTQVVKLIKDLDTVRSERKDAATKFRLLLLGDDRAHIPVWADTVFGRSEVSGEVAGVAYTCDATKVSPYDNLEYLTRRYPGKYMLATQGSINAPIKLGNWQHAENYATEMVKNLAFGSVGWIDFNLALNLEGGPYISEKFKGKHTTIVRSAVTIFERSSNLYLIPPRTIQLMHRFWSMPSAQFTTEIPCFMQSDILVDT